MLYQLSYEARHWEQGQFIVFISSLRGEMMWSIYEIIHIFELQVVDQIFELFHIYSFLTGDMNSINWPRSQCVWLIAQLVEHRTGIAEVTGSNPVEALIFSGFFFSIA